MIVITVFALSMLLHAAVVRHVLARDERPRLAAVGGSTPAAFSAEHVAPMIEPCAAHRLADVGTAAATET
jgi:hypothetical protein